MLRFDTEEDALKWAERHVKSASKHVEKQEKAVPPVSSEHAEQVGFIYWTDVVYHQYPDLDLIYAVPNGGDRNPVVAVKLSAEGVKPGVPDLCLPVPRGTFHGLYIEMKRMDGGNGTTPKQEKYIERLTEQGYLAVVCNGFGEARLQIIEYYSLGPFRWEDKQCGI